MDARSFQLLPRRSMMLQVKACESRCREITGYRVIAAWREGSLHRNFFCLPLRSTHTTTFASISVSNLKFTIRIMSTNPYCSTGNHLPLEFANTTAVDVHLPRAMFSRRAARNAPGAKRMASTRPSLRNRPTTRQPRTQRQSRAACSSNFPPV
jgi:hypothetical protein